MKRVTNIQMVTNNKRMKVLRILILVALVMSMASCKFFKSKPDKMLSNDVDSLLNQPVEIVEEEPEEEPAEIVTLVEETVPVDITQEPKTGYGSNRYYMVVGSFLSEQLANKYAKTLQDMGYDPQVLYSSSYGYYRVSAKSYDNFSVAVNDISSFRGSVTNRAWVHVKK